MPDYSDDFDEFVSSSPPPLPPSQQRDTSNLIFSNVVPEEVSVDSTPPSWAMPPLQSSPPRRSNPYRKSICDASLCHYSRLKEEGKSLKDIVRWSNYSPRWYIDKDVKYLVHKTSERYVLHIILDKKNLENKKWIRDKSICTDCGQIYPISKLKKLKGVFGNGVCDECFDQYIVCKICKHLFHSTEIKQSKEKDFYCKNCYYELFASCARCEDEISSADVIMFHDDSFCIKCYEQHFSTCSDCGEVYYKEDLRPVNDNLYCNKCYRAFATIKEYNYIPEQFKFNKNKWDNGLNLGIELEIEHNSEKKVHENLAREVLLYLKSIKLGDKFYIKHDGTINGFELVSHPATLSYIHTNISYCEILKWLSKKGFTSYKTGQCGLHVHLSKDFFSAMDIHKMRLFFITNQLFISKFSKRDGKTTYCKYESYSVKEFIKNGKRQDGKYLALRVTSSERKPTLEIRVFRGTLLYPRFIASLQFCDALSHYVKRVSIVHCQNKSSWLSFIQWTQNTNRYGHFIKYISDKTQLTKAEI